MSALRSIRKSAGISREALASGLGVVVSTIGHYETGRRYPDLRQARALVKVLQGLGCSCTLDEVFPPDEEVQQAA